MRPVNGHIVVEIDKRKKTIAGGAFELSTEDSRNHRYNRATVIAVCVEAEKLLKEGDVIFYMKGRDFSLPIGGKDRTIVKLTDIVAVE